MKIFLFVVGTLTFLAMLRGAYISGIHNNTTIFLGGITFALWVYAYFSNTLRKKKWLTVSIFTLMACTLIFSIFLAFYGRRVTVTFTEDVAIVLGAGTHNGEILSTLARRLDKAVSFHEQNPNALIIVSGGLGHRDVVTEAYVMAQYLIERGIPAERILLEDHAHSTYTNMRYSRLLLDAYFQGQELNVVIITSNFHMYRSVWFSQQTGVAVNATMYPSSVPWYAIPLAYVREVASVVKMWVIGR